MNQRIFAEVEKLIALAMPLLLFFFQFNLLSFLS